MKKIISIVFIVLISIVKLHAQDPRLTPYGGIQTMAGINNSAGSYNGDLGLAYAANLNSPSSVTVDAAGNYYIADKLNNVIRRVDAVTGIITTVVGKYPGNSGYAGDNSDPTNALLNAPSSCLLYTSPSPRD